VLKRSSRAAVCCPDIAQALYGAGHGIWSIASGILPLALFRQSNHPVVIGRLAMPNLLAQAASPHLQLMCFSKPGPIL